MSQKLLRIYPDMLWSEAVRSGGWALWATSVRDINKLSHQLPPMCERQRTRGRLEGARTL